MKEVYFTAASCCLLACIFAFLHQQAQLNSKPVIVPAPPPAPPATLPAPSPSPPGASVKYVGDDSWLVTLVATGPWFDSGIPVAVAYRLRIEPEEPSADCQFLLRLSNQIYSSEVVVEASVPDTQRILRQFPWSEMPPDALAWVDTVKLKLAESCRRSEFTLHIESASQLGPDDALLQLEENAEQRQRVLTGHEIAHYLRRQFETNLAAK